MRYIQIRRLMILPVICILAIRCFIPSAARASKGLDLLEQIRNMTSVRLRQKSTWTITWK